MADPAELRHWDVNGLYSAAMREPLAVADFKWAGPENVLFDIDKLPLHDLTGDQGCLMEVDCHVPEACHEFLSDYPPMPERQVLPNGQERLVLDLRPKMRYLVHGRLLQFYVRELGVVVTKIHRVITFTQAPVFKSFIDDSYARQLADPACKPYEKLCRNSCYGRLLLDSAKFRSTCLVQTNMAPRRLERLLGRPSLCSADIVADGRLMQLTFQKAFAQRTEPLLTGFCVMELAKLKMYTLWYAIKRAAPEVALCYSDTDSAVALVPKSAEPALTALPIWSQSAIGLLKDECEGRRIQELVAIAPKTYSILMADAKEKQKAAGLPLPPRHAAYREALFTGTAQAVAVERLVSEGQQVKKRIVDVQALATKNFGRHICEDGIHTLPFGHSALADA